MDSTSDYHLYCGGGFDPEDIVISGISGRFPECDNVGELKDGIYNKKPLIVFSDARYAKGVTKNLYPSCGLVKNLDKVDADYFCLNHAAANSLEPQTRIHMEVTYECMADAGYDPDDLKGSNIGIYNATTGDDGQILRLTQTSEITLHSIRTMNPNRTSFALDLRGPSHSIDAACSSSAIAFHSAITDIKHGYVDAAVVSGCQLNLDPEKTTAYFMAGICSLAGHSVPYDANSDGMLRTEAISAIYIQKAKNARRVYATVMGSEYHTSGYVPEGISVPSATMQSDVCRELLKKAGVQPDEIEYIEGHGTGTHVGDPIELNSMSEVYLENRKKPLHIGTIKSNIGHTEATSGVCGIINAILALETGRMPPNIKYKDPNPRCPALMEGKLKVVTDPIPLHSPYVPVNSFGFGGTIVQTLLKKNPINKPERKSSALPRLVLYPGTTEEAITTVFEFIKHNHDLGDEFFGLLNKLSFTSCLLKPFRGFYLFKDPKSPVYHVKNVTGTKREVWFIMTGMGCQWPGMGLQLMCIDVFAKSMRKSAETLKPFGVDLFELLRADKNHLQVDRSITPAFVAISAIQIGLVDLMTHLGIKPDGIIGHSTGELICAYADGCCTAEQTILSAFYRGKAVEGGNLESGAMAAVGLSWEEAQKRCPEGIYPACDNAADSVTISGLKDSVEKFVSELKQENIFARVVNAYGYAFHSKYVHPVAGKLKLYLKKLITEPKPRTERWVSTSYPEEEWDDPQSKIANAEYFVHNLMSSVRFHDGIKKIPSDAITIEIGPHFLLQSILKRAVGSEAIHLGLMKRNDENNVQFFFESLGKLYNEGLNPQIELLYPPVQFPVPRGTPTISDLIKWNHSQSFSVPRYIPRTGPCHIDIKPNKGDAYLLDHCIDGRPLFPATGYIWMVWEVLSIRIFKDLNEVPVVIENFKIHRATVLNPQTPIRMTVTILTGTGFFEIKEGNSLVASGYIHEAKDLVYDEDQPTYKCDDYSAVSGSDLYNELKMAGYEYGPAFQSLLEINMEGTSGLVLWKNKWIPFLDALLLFFGLLENNKDFYLPTGALSVKLDPIAFRNFINKKNSDDATDTNHEYAEDTVPVTYNPNTQTCRSIGIEIKKLTFDLAPFRGKDDVPTTEKYKFVPYISPYTPPKELEFQFSNYMGMCNKVMSDIRKATGKNLSLTEFPVANVNAAAVEFYSKTQSDERRLLNVLTEISNSVTSISIRTEEWLSSYSQSIGLDVLNNSLVNGDSLKIMMEVIAENSFRKLSVLEVKQNFPLVLPTMLEMTAKYSHMKFKKCSLVVTKDHTTDAEILKKHGIQLLQAEDFKADKKHDLVISSFMSGSESELQELIHTLTGSVTPNGFIMLFYKEKVLPAEKFLFSLCGEELKVLSQVELSKAVQIEDLVTISKISDSFGGGLYLLRPAYRGESNKVVYVTEDSYSWVEDLKKELFSADTERLWLVSQDSPVSGIVGMVNCLKQEPKGERIRCVFISQNDKKQKLPAFSLEDPVYKPLLERNMLINVWYDGAWGAYRHIQMTEHKQPRMCENCYLNIRKPGDLSTLEWIESPIMFSKKDNDVPIQIYYSALNFKDIMLSSGKISLKADVDDYPLKDCLIGLEYSGREPNGQRVCGFLAAGGIATSALANYILRIPDHWTLEEAATVPVVYITSYYALLMRAQLKKEDSILIHSGTGGIGIAAIRIALFKGCEVFVTVGTDEKRQILRKMFPQIKEENIGYSRNLTFETMIMNRTKGRGVDVVLNSLAEDKLQASLRCLTRFGRFIEIGKYDLLQDNKIGLKMFLEDRQFHGVCVDKMFRIDVQSQLIIRAAWSLLEEGLKTGVVQPLDRTVFDKNQVEDAFRYMMKGVHTGKVVIKIRDEEPAKRAIPKPLLHPAIPKTYFYNRKVYIIVGGLGGFGIEVTKWIVDKGGRHIILTSRFGARTPYHHLCLKRWKRQGADVQVSTLNVTRRIEAQQLLREASRIGPVGGIFNSAVVLKDAFMDCQTPDGFQEVCEPKATATKYLDELSRALCPQLDYFVCFSSMSCGRGNAGQTNYGFANSVMERVCEERKRVGLHGLAIQWGIIGGVGVVHRHMGDDAMIAGVIAQNVKSCLSTMEELLQQDCAVTSSYMTAVEKKRSGKGDVLAQLAKVLGMSDISKINPARSFGTLGFDSMIGVELKQLIESNCDVTLTMQEIQDMKIGDVKDLLEKAESDKVANPHESLLATSTLMIPSQLLHTDPLVCLNQDSIGTSIYFLHVGDIDIEVFKPLAQILEKPTFGIFWTADTPATDIEAAGAWFYQKMAVGVFNLIASGISGNLALQVALHSQRTNKKVKSLTLLNASEDLVNILNREDTETKDTDVETLCQFVEQFGPRDIYRLKEELQKVSKLEQRIKTVIQFITTSSSKCINKNEITTAISNFMLKKSLVQSFAPKEKIALDVHLVEDPAKVLPNDVTMIKESFAQVVTGKVNVDRICSVKELSSIHDAQRVANVISTYI